MQNGYCLSDFVKKGVFCRFALNNIDLMKDTATGKDNFHRTLAVMFQRDIDGPLKTLH